MNILNKIPTDVQISIGSFFPAAEFKILGSLIGGGDDDDCMIYLNENRQYVEKYRHFIEVVHSIWTTDDADIAEVDKTNVINKLMIEMISKDGGKIYSREIFSLLIGKDNFQWLSTIVCIYHILLRKWEYNLLDGLKLMDKISKLSASMNHSDETFQIYRQVLHNLLIHCKLLSDENLKIVVAKEFLENPDGAFIQLLVDTIPSLTSAEFTSDLLTSSPKIIGDSTKFEDLILLSNRLRFLVRNNFHLLDDFKFEQFVRFDYTSGDESIKLDDLFFNLFSFMHENSTTKIGKVWCNFLVTFYDTIVEQLSSHQRTREFVHSMYSSLKK